MMFGLLHCHDRNFIVKVSEELHRRFKIACAPDGDRKMSEVIREAMERTALKAKELIEEQGTGSMENGTYNTSAEECD